MEVRETIALINIETDNIKNIIKLCERKAISKDSYEELLYKYRNNIQNLVDEL